MESKKIFVNILKFLKSLNLKLKLTSLIELGRSAKETVIGFVLNFSNISDIKRAQLKNLKDFLIYL